VIPQTQYSHASFDTLFLVSCVDERGKQYQIFATSSLPAHRPSSQYPPLHTLSIARFSDLHLSLLLPSTTHHPRRVSRRREVSRAARLRSVQQLHSKIESVKPVPVLPSPEELANADSLDRSFLDLVEKRNSQHQPFPLRVDGKFQSGFPSLLHSRFWSLHVDLRSKSRPHQRSQHSRNGIVVQLGEVLPSSSTLRSRFSRSLDGRTSKIEE